MVNAYTIPTEKECDMARFDESKMQHITVKYGDTMMLEEIAGMGAIKPGEAVIIKPGTDYSTPDIVVQDADWLFIPWHRVMTTKIRTLPTPPTS